MISGILAGILWGLDTVILGVALSMSTFVSAEQAIVLAPFVSTFIHDFCSSVWMLLYMGIKKQYRNILRAVKTRSGKFIILGALLGGPIGMSGYVAAINYIGPAYTAIISSMFSALGAFLSYIFLKEKMSPIQLCGLGDCFCISSASYSAGFEKCSLRVCDCCGSDCCSYGFRGMEKAS